MQVSNRTLEVLASCQEAEAQRLSIELSSMQQVLEDVNDKSSIQFLNVLRGFLDHKVSKEIESLGGMYSRAADRILNQVANNVNDSTNFMTCCKVGHFNGLHSGKRRLKTQTSRTAGNNNVAHETGLGEIIILQMSLT